MAGENARDAAQRLQQKADELMNQVAEKESLIGRLRNETAEEKRELAREAAVAANPATDTGPAGVIESQQEITTHSARIRQLESEIVDMKNEINRLNDDKLRLLGMADSAEEAEGRANDSAERAVSGL